MNNPFFQIGVAFAGLIVLSVAYFEGPDVAASMGWVESTEPVLVFEIPQPGALARVRGAISDDRILWEGEAGFALERARIYVRDLKDAGPMIARAGWVDRPIQIVGLGMESEPGASEGESGSGWTPERRAQRLRELIHKPTLTRAEQVFVLQAMNDGFEI